MNYHEEFERFYNICEQLISNSSVSNEEAGIIVKSKAAWQAFINGVNYYSKFFKIKSFSDDLFRTEFFAVRNREGQWYHRKGLGGYGETWREDVEEARIYNKIGPARAQVTFFATNWPSFGVPEIVVFKIGEISVINEEERIKKLQQKKNKKTGIKLIKTYREVQKKHNLPFQEGKF